MLNEILPEKDASRENQLYLQMALKKDEQI